MRVRSNAQLYVAARKAAIKKLRTKKYPKYDELPMQGKVKVDQQFMQKFGAAIDKMAKKLVKVLKTVLLFLHSDVSIHQLQGMKN